MAEPNNSGPPAAALDAISERIYQAQAIVASADVIELCCPWQQAADESDRAAWLIGEIPGMDDFVLTAESQEELRAAAVLMRQANEILRKTAAREVPRFDSWSEAHPEFDEGEDAANSGPPARGAAFQAHPKAV